MSGDEFEEIDVGFEENELYKLRRLRDEGYAENIGELVPAALSSANESRGFAVDPSLEQRISELNIIERELLEEDEVMTENKAVDLFADTSYYAQKFGRLSVDEDYERKKKYIEQGRSEEEIEERLWRSDVEQQLTLVDKMLTHKQDSIYTSKEDFVIGTIGFMEKFKTFAQYQGKKQIVEEVEDYLENYFTEGKLDEDISL